MVELIHKPQWCPGCGNFGILLAVKKALEDLGIEPWKTVIVSGIGCSGKFPHYIKTYGFEGIHGRALPVATGIKLANPDLTVIAAFGDGDGYGIGGNHLIHASRRNPDIVGIGFNNGVYALTTGQTSPTSPEGTGKTWKASMEKPLDPISLVLAAGGSFVARGFAGNPGQLAEIIKKAIEHRGFGFVDVLQPCVSWNNTYEYYRERVKEISPAKTRTEAMELSRISDTIPTGIFYESDEPSMEEKMEIKERLGMDVPELSGLFY